MALNALQEVIEKAELIAANQNGNTNQMASNYLSFQHRNVASTRGCQQPWHELNNEDIPQDVLSTDRFRIRCLTESELIVIFAIGYPLQGTETRSNLRLLSQRSRKRTFLYLLHNKHSYFQVFILAL